MTQALIVIVAASVLSADEFGRDAIGLGAAALCIAASDGGVGIVATRELAQGIVNPRTLVPKAFLARGVLITMVIALGALLPRTSSAPRRPSQSCGSACSSVAWAPSTLSAGRSSPGYPLSDEAAIQVAERGLLLVLSLLVLSHGLALDLLLVALVARGAGVLARLAVLAKRSALWEHRLCEMRLRALVTSAAPLGVAVVLATIYFQVDVLMLGAMVDEASAGVYQAAVSILLLAYLVPESIAVALVPAFSRAAVEDKTRLAATFSRAATDLASVGIGAGLVLLTMGPLIAAVLYPSMTGAGLLLQVLAFACLFRFLSYALSSLMPSIGHGGARLMAAVAASVVNVGLNLVVIPQFGAMGAAVATVVTEAMLLFSYLASVPTSVVPIDRLRLLGPVALGLALAGVAWLVMTATGVGLAGLAAAVAAWEILAAIRRWERPSRIGVRLLGSAAVTLGWRS